MSRNDILHLDSIISAFYKNRKDILIIACLQILLCFITTLRYFSLLNLFNIRADFKNVTAATFVSNALGLWMPGSMAFIEIIRITLMMGAEHNELSSNENINQTLSNAENKKSEGISKNKKDLSIRSRLTTASLFDRLIGLWSMLIFGLVFIAYLIIHNSNNMMNKSSLEFHGLISIFALTIFLFIAISLLPFLSGKIFLRKILDHTERIILRIFRKTFIHRFLRKLTVEINAILDAISHGGTKMNMFVVPVLYSFLCVIIQAFSFYYSALALQSFIPFTAILATISILALATLLPIGFGGVGGVQFIAAITLSIFGVSTKIAASAQLLQTAVNLLSISFVGLFFLQLTSKQVRTAFQLYTNKKSTKKN